jgi:broad specificity phosphatase PhoE
MSVLEIELIRHVKVAGKAALYGSTDIPPLAVENEHLLRQLIAQQKTENAYQSIICSPLHRCQSLAMNFSQACQLPMHVCEDLQEINFGIVDGVPFDEMGFGDASADTKGADIKGPDIEDIDELSKDGKTSIVPWSLLEQFFQAPAVTVLPGGEPIADFSQRVIQAWQQLVQQQLVIASAHDQHYQLNSYQCKNPRRVLVVAHGGVIRMILAHILQLDWQQASWHQQLQIGHASLTRICLSQPFENEKTHQQITTIAMPFLKDPHDGK